MLKDYAVTEDVESGCLLHQYTAACLRVDFFGLCIILRRMSSVTSGMRTEGGLRFRALATEPVARHFLTNACMALFTARPLPWKYLPKISRVSLIESVFMHVSIIATLSATEYVIVNNKAQCSSLNATYNWTYESRPTTCDLGRPAVGGVTLTTRLLTTIYAIYTITLGRISQGQVQNGRN